MSFEDTTRKMADEVAEAADYAAAGARAARRSARTDDARAFAETVQQLAEATKKLARCVARRFPGQVDDHGREVRALVSRPVPPARADGALCRDCGGMTVPTGACSTCTVCGSTGGCG